MELQDYLRTLRKRWRIIAATILFTLAAAAAYTILAPRSYEAKTELFVSTSSGDSVLDLAQGGTFSQQRVKSYADVLTSPIILDPVIQQQSLQLNSAQLERKVTTTVPLDTVLIELAVRDEDPVNAARIAEGIAKQFIDTVDEIEKPGASADNPVAVTILRPAVAPTTPVSPSPVRNLALALVLGTLLGLGLALTRELLDTRVRSERDLEGVSDHPILGGVHYDERAAREPLVVQGDPQSPRAEAFRALRTNLQFVDTEHNLQAIVLTSSLPGEGKTTTTANLGLTMTEAGYTVCLVEADLRRPRLLDYMGLDGSVGLTNVLIGEAELDDVLQPFGAGSTMVLGAGPIPPNPSELLGSSTMREILRQLRSRFDYVLLDAPPVLPVTDAAVLGRVADGVIVVVGATVVRKEQVARALENLHRVNAPVLGFVANRLPTKGEATYAYYGEGQTSLPPEEQEPSLRRRAQSARAGSSRRR
ncbi:cell shape-determining protein [Knoellia sinensis KCTC 19936]|uniref:non-specific protein-tyrosine kinase n=1 Tax=Knoellia sinensis KCTC 19936 TaxID=1385520 RepID=A0A0A0JBN9_9MICO|nr:polysaccharide biosynthesis tyrosine autokinase [Knoellia sinensis]KGN34563.1 cell shape-determining protein [Knoellia sinensis KCTC 19936]